MMCFFFKKKVIRGGSEFEVIKNESHLVGKISIPFRHLITKWDSNHQIRGVAPNLFLLLLAA